MEGKNIVTIKEILRNRTDLNMKYEDYLKLVKKHQKDMFDLIDKTRETDKEHGFKLCYDNQNNFFFKDKETMGKKGEISIDPCGKKKDICTFHTHNYNLLPISREDILGSLSHSDLFLCVGAQGHGEEKDEIHCYELTYDIDSISEISNSEDKKSFKKATSPLFTLKRDGSIKKRKAPYW